MFLGLAPTDIDTCRRDPADVRPQSDQVHVDQPISGIIEGGLLAPEHGVLRGSDPAGVRNRMLNGPLAPTHSDARGSNPVNTVRSPEIEIVEVSTTPVIDDSTGVPQEHKRI